MRSDISEKTENLAEQLEAAETAMLVLCRPAEEKDQQGDIADAKVRKAMYDAFFM